MRTGRLDISHTDEDVSMFNMAHTDKLSIIKTQQKQDLFEVLSGFTSTNVGGGQILWIKGGDP